MYGLKHSIVRTDIAGWNESQASDQAAAQVRKNISVQVLHYHNIKLVWIHDKLHAGVIDDFIITFNLWIFLCNLFENGKEHAIGHFQDICLMNTGYLGENETAGRIRKAVDEVLAEGKHLTRDLHGTATTEEYVDAVIARL